jgi:AcrR family transcriptional regulator
VNKRPTLLSGEDFPPAPLQKRSMAKRARLNEAALALFGEKGYEATAIEDIASRANLAVGTFYQHYRSKRQLLLVLMDDLLEKLSQLDFRVAPRAGDVDVHSVLRSLLMRAFAADLHYLGAYRAWQEAMLSDPSLGRKNAAIHEWTSARVSALFRALQRHPAARRDIDVAGLAQAMDSFFWSLLGRAVQMPKVVLRRQVEAATHLIFHALFRDS